MLTNHRKSILLHDLPGFLWFPMAYLCLHATRIDLAAQFTWFLLVSYGLSALTKTQEVNLPARFTWFLMVSYGLVVFRNHKNPICPHVLFGFLWFPMAYLSLQNRGSQFACTIYLVSFGFLWPSCACKS